MAQSFNQQQLQILLRLPDEIAGRVQQAIDKRTEETANDAPNSSSSSSSSSSSIPSPKQEDAGFSLEMLGVRPVKYETLSSIALYVH